MQYREYHLRDGKMGTALAIRVMPEAKNDEIVKILQDGVILIHLTSSQNEDISNDALRKYLANLLGVPKKKVDVVGGRSGIDKLVSIIDIEAEIVQKKILENIS